MRSPFPKGWISTAAENRKAAARAAFRCFSVCCAGLSRGDPGFDVFRPDHRSRLRRALQGGGRNLDRATRLVQEARRGTRFENSRFAQLLPFTRYRDRHALATRQLVDVQEVESGFARVRQRGKRDQGGAEERKDQ